MKTMRAVWIFILMLVCGFALQAQQQVNNFRVLTNLTVSGSAYLNAPVLTNGTAVSLTGSLTNVTVDGGRIATKSRSDSVVLFGDSVVNGSSASTLTNTWWYLVARQQGWSYTNLAFGGAVVTDINWQSQPGYSRVNGYDSVLYYTPLATATNLNIIAKVGINDGEDFPTTSTEHAAYLTHYYHSWLHFAAQWATPGKIDASSATASGTWTAWTNHFSASVGQQTTTSGDTLTFETHGDAIYVAFPVALTNATSFGKFYISVDGTAIDLVDPNGVGFGNRNQYDTPSGSIPFSATNAFWVNRYSGYGSRRHYVVVTATNNATLPTVITWVAGSQQPIGPNSGPNVFLVEHLDRLGNLTRDATSAALRAKVDQVASELGGDGLQVAIVRPNGTYDVATGLSGDNVHPNDTGMAQVAQAVNQAIDRFRGLALSSSSSSGSGLSTAGSGLTASSGSVSLGGSLTADATLSGGAYGVSISRNSGGNALTITPGSGVFGVHTRTDSNFNEVHDSSGTPQIFLRKLNGSIASPSAVTTGQTLGSINFTGRASSGSYLTAASIRGVSGEGFTGSATGGRLEFLTTPIGTTATAVALTIEDDGTITVPGILDAQGGIEATTVSASDAITITTANTQLNLNGDSKYGIIATRESDSTEKNIAIRRARVGPAAVQNGDVIGALEFYPRNDTTYPGVRARYRAEATQTHTAANQGTKAVISATPDNSSTMTDQLTVTGAGIQVAGTATVTGATTLNGTTGINAATTITTSSTQLSLLGDSQFGLLVNRASDSGYKSIAIQRARAANAAVQSGDIIGALEFYPRNDTTYPGVRARYRAQATETHSSTNQGTSLILSATANGSTSMSDALTITGGGVSVSGVAEVFPTTTTLAYSGTNVTQTSASRAYYQSALVLTNDCLLTITGTDGASGGIVFKPDSSTSYTVYLDTGIKLLGGGTSFVVTNSASELVNFEWKQVYVNGADRILANKAVYP